MPRQVIVVDYGMGNVLSVRRALEHCGSVVKLSDRPDEIAGTDLLVLPGVGAFADCMKALEHRGLVEPVKAFVATGRPFLGICVGMQILLDHGDEFGGYPGLGLIPGRVVQIESQTAQGDTRKIPHIGWAPLIPVENANDDRWSGSILDDTQVGTSFYFVHSYNATPSNTANILATADYAGTALTAVIKHDNVTGTQFHPEKSGASGLALLHRFIRG